MPYLHATAMALGVRWSVLSFMSYGGKTESSMAVQPSHKMCPFHAVSNRKQHRFQRSWDHVVRKTQVFDPYYLLWKYLFALDVRNDDFAFVTRLTICYQLYETTVIYGYLCGDIHTKRTSTERPLMLWAMETITTRLRCCLLIHHNIAGRPIPSRTPWARNSGFV